jgi:hypothetical protein
MFGLKKWGNSFTIWKQKSDKNNIKYVQQSEFELVIINRNTKKELTHN